MHDILGLKYTSQEIESKRCQVAELFISRSPNVKSPDINEISNRDLRLLFEIYDEVFLANWFKERYTGTLKFSFSRRMTRSAGKTLYPKDINQLKKFPIEIRISIDIIFAHETLAGDKQVGGISTRNSLEALQLVLEHEIIHVIEFIHFQESSCKQSRFKSLAQNIFGHTKSYHSLPTSQQIARQKLGLAIGDKVEFQFEDKILTGSINAINKRATVMVPDPKGVFADKQGNRYTKYYVPLQLLKPSGQNRSQPR